MNTIIIGAGGHARVVHDILEPNHNIDVTAFVDNTPRGSDEQIMGTPVIGDHSVIPGYVEKNDVTGYVVAVGDNEIRRDHFEKLREMGLEPVRAIHPQAHVSETADIGEGTVVAPGAIVTTNAEIGPNAIINTGSVVEHESEIGGHTHVAPGSTVAGRVTIGTETFVGMGTSIKEYTEIGSNVVVGAGSVVLDDIESGDTVAGAPAEVKSGE